MRYDIIKRRTVLLGAVLWAALACQCWAAVLYVDDDANGLGDGSSWANAFVYLQDALALARTIHPPIEIRVAQGMYTPDRGAGQAGLQHGNYGSDPTFDLVESVVLKGGYAGVGEPDPNARDVHKYQTTLSGDLLGNDAPVASPQDLLDEPTRSDNCRCVVTGVQLTAAAVLDGFTITGGNDRRIPRDGAGWGGPGIRLVDASPTITNCWLQGNCIRAGDGGAILSYGSNPTVANCVFSGNCAGQGGAIATYSGDATVINCTFSNNWASRGGAIFDRCAVSNCILWGDQPDEIGWYEYSKYHSMPVVTWSDVAGGWPGEGNLDVDPCFVEVNYWADPNNTAAPVDANHPNAVRMEGDYHLKSQGGRFDPNIQSWVQDDITSPCIDAGDPNSPVGEEPEPNGGRINMGAYGGTAEASKSCW
jgi:hypothetical protein